MELIPEPPPHEHDENSDDSGEDSDSDVDSEELHKRQRAAFAKKFDTEATDDPGWGQ